MNGAGIAPPVPLLTSGARFRQPELACSAPVRINPHYPVVYERNAAWIAEFLPLEGPPDLHRILERRYPMWDCLTFPDCTLLDRLTWSSCFTSVMFEIDDVAFLRRALFDEVAGDWEEWMVRHPYARAFGELWSPLEQRMPEGVYRRFRRGWQDFFTGTLEENEYRKREEIPDLDAYVAVRRASLGIRPYVAVAEYLLDMDLSAELASDADLVAAGQATVDHLLFTNDMYSFRQECFAGDCFNTIAVLMRTEGRSLQEAVDFTAERVREADQALSTLCAALTDRYRDDLRILAYLRNLRDLCAGNLRWSLETTRYHGAGTVWTGARAATVELHPERTVVLPD